MSWKIAYYSDSLQEEILAMPSGFLGRYLRYSDRIEEVKDAHPQRT